MHRFIIILFLLFLPFASVPVYTLTEPSRIESAYGLREFRDDPHLTLLAFTFEESMIVAEKYSGWIFDEILFYDLGDMPYFLWWKDPIFSLGDNGTYLSRLRRTKNFSGAKAIRLLKEVQSELGIEKICLFDMAKEMSCPKNGTLCQDQICHDFSLTSVFMHGKKYYEKEGAHPDNEDPVLNEQYRLHADFIYNLPLDLMMNELRAFQNVAKAREQLDVIQHCLDLTGLDEESVTCSELFREVYKLGKTDVIAHQAYHDFKDKIIFQRLSYPKNITLDPAYALELFSRPSEQLYSLPKGTLSMLLKIAKTSIEEFEDFAFHLSDL